MKPQRRSLRNGRSLALIVAMVLVPILASAHNVSAADRAALAASHGAQPFVYAYLGAKHMVTGYDHLLFLFGVIFFLYRLRDVATYVTLFAVGHSITLLGGVLGRVQVNPSLIDAIIGFSVVYKAFENMGGFRALFGASFNPKAAVFLFGLCHGLGLATKLQTLQLDRDGLLPNLISFNVGVEIGQVLALVVMVALINVWRRSAGFERRALLANGIIMSCGFVLIGWQIAGFFRGEQS